MSKTTTKWQTICQNRYSLRLEKCKEYPELSTRQARKAVRENIEARVNPNQWERAVEINSAQ